MAMNQSRVGRELLAPGQVLEGELPMAAEEEGEDPTQAEQESDHRAELRMRFGVKAETSGAAEVLARLREAAARGASTGFAIVASMPGLRPPLGWGGGRAGRRPGRGPGSTSGSQPHGCSMVAAGAGKQADVS